MSDQRLPYRIFELGDNAITIDFGNRIDDTINLEVVARYKDICGDLLPGMIEAVPAYSSLSIFFNPLEVKRNWAHHQTAIDWIKKEVEKRLLQPITSDQQEETVFRIPVCYENELAPDLTELAAAKNITIEEVIRIHISKQYKVYMLGFLPGFPYLGEVDERIAMPRKSQPMNVIAGSVGIAGKQTGIYSLTSPGGWQIIGRTVLKIFDSQRNPCTLLKAGDTVEFYSISRDEFESY